MKHVELAGKIKIPSHWTKLAAVSLIAMAALVGCGGGSDGAPGAAGAAGEPGTPADPKVLNDLTAQITALTQATDPETCVACHDGAFKANGPAHQDEYNKAKSNLLTVTIDDPVTDIVAKTSTLTFTAKLDGVALNAAAINAMGQKRLYAVNFNGSKVDKTFSYANFTDVGGKIQATNTAATWDPVASNAQIWGVLASTTLNNAGGLYDNVVNFGKAYGAVATAPKESAANQDGCVKCHGALGGDKNGAGGIFMKAGYRAAHVDGLTDFNACRSCHVDDPLVAAAAAKGGHYEWQILADNPARMAEINALVAAAKAKSPVDTAHDSISKNLTPAELTKYAYIKSVMNDVHMSHGMEFPYPQAMNSCVTCHYGADAAKTAAKLDMIFDANQFKAETCISCHSVEGIKTKMKAAGFTHTTQTATDVALRASNCSTCHNGADAPTSRTIHNGGYNPKIYATNGTRYSTAVTAAVNSVAFDSATNKLTIKVTAQGTVGDVKAENIVPTVMVGLYGYDSKDFLVAAHGSQADKSRNLEYAYGGTNPRFQSVGKTTTGGVTTWELTANLSLWADKIAAGAVKRAEVAVMPTLKHPTILDPASTTTPKANLILALDAPSKTFNLVTKAFVPSTAIVPAGATTCNNCHDALGTTFHSGDRGGSLVVCRICHEVSSPGSHLEMQSRSIDSYVHAIHSFQAFDIQNIDLTDPVAAMKYNHHVTSTYPNFTVKNCESCHAPGTYDVPNQSKSMPSVSSKSQAFKAGTRNISGVAQSVTGPASRACGSCHRSQAINANAGLGDSTQLAILNSHIKQNGYIVDASAYSSTTTPTLNDLWSSITTKLMAVFK